MSVPAAIFRKDLLQFRVLITFLLGSLAVLLAVRLEWTGSVMPDPAANGSIRLGIGLEGLLFMVSVITAGKLASNALFADSPGRPERFLATRPVSGRLVLLAKLLFLAVFVAAPFALAAAVYLALSGMPARVVFLGTAQSLVRSGVLIALAVPALLLWETRGRFIAGLLAAGLGIGAFSLAIGLLFMRGFPIRPDVFSDPLVQVKAVAITALVLGVVAAVHFRRRLGLPLRLALVFLATVIAPLLGGISASRQPAVAIDKVPRCEIVQLGFNATYSGDKPVLGISLTPSTPAPSDEDTRWGFTSLRLGEHTLPLRPRPDPRLTPGSWAHSDHTQGIEAALRRQLGPGWAMISRTGSCDWSPHGASAFARPPRIPDGEVPIKAVLQGHRFSWHCVAELPFTPGSSARHGEETWIFGSIARDQINRFAFSLRHIGPELWLAPRGGRRSFEKRGQVFVVLDPEQRIATMLGHQFPVRSTLGNGTACPRRGLRLHIDGGDEINDLVSGDPTRLRLLVLRPRYEGTCFARWASPSPVALPTPRRNSSGSSLAHNTKDLKPDDIARWIRDNPPPAATEADSAIVPWLVALLEQTNRCPGLHKEHPAVETLANYVPAHLDLLLRAMDALFMDQHTSEQVLLDAIHSGLEHRQLPEIVHRIQRHPQLLRAIEQRGWASDLAPDLARLVRNGRYPDRAIETLAALPDAGGLSTAEWLAVFRLSPGARNYRILREIPGLENELNAVIDARFDSHIPTFSDHAIDPLLKLALTRGHAGAPALLHRAILYSKGLHSHYAHWLSDDVTGHFELPRDLDRGHDDEAIIAWFLARDPADFTYDPDRRRYRLDPATS